MGKVITIVLLIVLAVAVSGVASYAQELTVSVEKAVYRPGETVVISGTGPTGKYIGVSIYNPRGTEVYYDLIKVGADGKYRIEVKLPPKVPYENWIYGKYTVKVYYGAVVREAYFELVAAGGVRGIVVDEKGKPIVEAKVVVKEVGIKTYTDSEGVFELALEEGSYTIEISKPGYKSVELLVSIEAGKVVDLGTIRLVSYDYLLGMLNATISELKEKLSTIEAAYTDVSKSLDRIAKSLESIAAEIRSLSDKVDAVSTKVDGLSDKVGALETAIKNNRAAIDALSRSVAEISTKIDGVKSDVADISGELSKVKSDILDAVTGLKTDIVATKDAVNAVKTSVTDMLKTVSDLVKTVKESVSTVEARIGELSTLVIVALILALIAAAASIYTAIQMVKKVAG